MAHQDESREPGFSRRTMLRGAAVGGVALPLLAACGGGSSSSDGPKGQQPGDATSPATVKASEVPVGGGKIITADKVVVTQPAKGDFKAFSAICTHQGCTVGSITNGEIVCPCHGSHYSIKNGAVLSGPAPRPLPAKKLTVKGDEISVT